MKWFDRLVEWYITRSAEKMKDHISYAKAALMYKDFSTQMSWNIYGGKEINHYFRKQFVIHMLFKYKLFHWFVNLTKRMLHRYIEQEVPKESYNIPMQVFDKSYDDAVHTWCMTYMRFQENNQPIKSLSTAREIYKSYTDVERGAHTLMTMKRLALAIPMNDTAYSEFLNIFMYSIYKNMDKVYHDKKVRHLFYNDRNTFDVVYYGLSKKFNEEDKVEERRLYEITPDKEVQE